MLVLKQLTKTYAKTKQPAVNNLDLHVKTGEIFGFIGPNGAGKTTAIKMITGILTPDHGQISINGHDMQTDPIAAKMSLGYVPDTQELYDRLTGLEYLNFIGDMYKVPANIKKQNIEKYLHLFD